MRREMTDGKWQKKVLLLNQNFEPITITGARKAICLLYLKKAELVSSYEGMKVKGVSTSWPLPSILRLCHYVRVRRREIPLTKRNIFRRDNYQCQYCGRTNVALTTDHIIPKSLGGEDTWENLVTACTECNTKKGAKTSKEFPLKLIRRPKKPNTFTFLLHSLSEIPEDWKPYLFQ
ncbi:MAG: HNH endonuclease [candidate division WOR-3 bacterium]